MTEKREQEIFFKTSMLELELLTSLGSKDSPPLKLLKQYMGLAKIVRRSEGDFYNGRYEKFIESIKHRVEELYGK